MEKEYITDSGVAVYAYALPHVHRFCMRLYLRAGVLYEAEKENGITHFLEHVCFRNLCGMPQRQLFEWLDRMGASFNACTYKELVYFEITGAPQHFCACARILSMLLAPLSAGVQDVDLERARIKREIREQKEESAREDFIAAAIWGETPLHRSIPGKIQDLNGIRLGKLRDKHRQIFRTNNLFFYCSGKFSSEDIAYLCQQIDAHPIQAEIQPARSNVAPLPQDFGRRSPAWALRNHPNAYLHFSFDMEIGRYRVAELDLLYDILFTGDASRFYRCLSDERGWIYDFDAGLEHFLNAGVLCVGFDIESKRLQEAAQQCMRIFASMKREIRQEDLDMVLPLYVDNSDFLLDDPEDLNWTMAYDGHILGWEFSTLEQRRNAYLTVRPERLRQIAKEIFQPHNFVGVAQGEKQRLQAIDWKELTVCLCD